jgi:hypothetical protein
LTNPLAYSQPSYRTLEARLLVSFEASTAALQQFFPATRACVLGKLLSKDEARRNKLPELLRQTLSAAKIHGLFC